MPENQPQQSFLCSEGRFSSLECLLHKISRSFALNMSSKFIKTTLNAGYSGFFGLKNLQSKDQNWKYFLWWSFFSSAHASFEASIDQTQPIVFDKSASEYWKVSTWSTILTLLLHRHSSLRRNFVQETFQGTVLGSKHRWQFFDG